MLLKSVPSARHVRLAQKLLEDFRGQIADASHDDLLGLVQRLQDEISPGVGYAFYEALRDQKLIP